MSHLRQLAPVASADVNSSACDPPAQVIGLSTNWKLQLPVDDPNQSGTQVREVTYPALRTFSQDPWFVATSSCDGIRFRNAVNAVTTSTNGTHTMVIDQAITHLPSTKPHVVAGQIHDGNDRSVFRVEGSNLYITRDNDSHYKLVTSNYRLGTRFEAKFVVSNGQIRAYYNGVLQTTIPVQFSTGYFKAGAYTQANCTNSQPCSASNYGEVVVYDVTVTHS